MQLATFIGVCGLIVSVWTASLMLANRLGRLEQRVDEMHDWWLAHIDIRIGGRRHTDIAADHDPES